MRNHSSSTAVLDRPARRPGTTGLAQTAGTGVLPLSYTQLRLLAESALAVGNVPASFCVDQNTGLTWVRAGMQVSEGAVVVPAYDPGKYPPVEEVLLQVEWQADPDANLPVAGSGEVNAVEVHADAVFWSDAAVQKFVFPYLASCAGHEAHRKVADLQSAWNFARTQVRVFAMMHVVRPSDETITLENSFQVAFVVFEKNPATGETTYDVTSMPLGAFTAAFGGTPEELKTGTEPGTEQAYTQPVFTALDQYPRYPELRQIAEYAASLTDTQYLVWSQGTGYPEAMEVAPEGVDNVLVIPARTPTVPEKRLDAKSVVFRPNLLKSTQWTLTPDEADALFWSAGSIQQFLLPYYASVRGFLAPDDLQKIIDAWQYNQLSGEPPIPPDAADGVRAPGSFGEADTEEDPTTTIVYGLVHLPKSEWSEVVGYVEAFARQLTPAERELLLAVLEIGDPFSAVHHVGVLHNHPDPDFGVRNLPLSFFSVLYPRT